jgi:hypothetical protein
LNYFSVILWFSGYSPDFMVVTQPLWPLWSSPEFLAAFQGFSDFLDHPYGPSGIFLIF